MIILLYWLLIILLNLDWAGRGGKVDCLVTTRGGRAGPGRVLVAAVVVVVVGTFKDCHVMRVVLCKAVRH